MFRLLRISIAFTPIADVLAGYLCVRARLDSPPPVDLALLAACAASIAVFCSAVSLNDFLDRKKDARLAPDRPIPSGGIPPSLALLISGFLGLSALALGGAAGLRTLGAVALVLCLTLGYNLFTRKSDLTGVLNLGAIRAADFLVGMSLVLDAGAPSTFWNLTPGFAPMPALMLYGSYAVGLSFIALAERGQQVRNLKIPAVIIALIAGAPAMAASLQGYAIPGICLWAVIVLPMVRWFQQDRKGAEFLVGHLVSGYFLLAALFVLAAGYPVCCAGLWVAYFLSRWLSRTFPPA